MARDRTGVVGGSSAPKPVEVAEQPQPPKAKRKVYDDGLVRVVSDGVMNKAEATAFAKGVRAAYEFDLQQHGWDASRPGIAQPITFNVLTNTGFALFTKAPFGQVGAATTDANTMALPKSRLDQLPDDYRGIVAHELVHILDARLGQDGLESVPMFVQEGKACVLGDLYKKGRAGAEAGHARVQRIVGDLTADRAKEHLSAFRSSLASVPSPDVAEREYTGALFVEFLRVRLNRSGRPDAIKRLGNVISDVGAGKTYEQSFQDQFGLTPATAESRFIEFLRSTEGKPELRLKGTIYANGFVRDRFVPAVTL